MFMYGSEALDQVTGAGLELAEALAALPASQDAATDEELIARLRVLGGVLRFVEGALLQTVGEVQQRSSSADRGARMTTRIGCRTVAEVIERAVGASGRTARQWVRAAGLITQPTDLSGAVVPGLFPAVADAARCGVLGTDGILAIAGVLNNAASRIDAAAVHEAEQFLVDLARGAHAVTDVAASADRDGSAAGKHPGAAWNVCYPASDLDAMSRAVLARIDPDGVEPAERIAMLKRGITLGTPVGGLVPIRGALLPEAAAQLQLLLDAYNNPAAPPIPLPFAMSPGGLDAPRVAGAADEDADGTGGEPGTSPADVEAVIGAPVLPLPRGGVYFRESTPTLMSPDSDVDAPPCVCGARDVNAAHAEHDSRWPGAGAEAGSAMACVCVPSRADDRRTPPQKRHDALSAILRIAAESGRAPALQGHAPTLLVRIHSAALRRRAGAPHDSGAHAGEGVGTDARVEAEHCNSGLTGDSLAVAHAEVSGLEMPISIATALRITCTGGVQHIHYDANQAVTAISSEARIFTPRQRRAINDRDRECIIPGCHVPATWCEHHHVTEWASGGPTHTSNAVAICFHHHRTLEQAGWRIRIREGVPEVQAPLLWDPDQRWIRKPHHRRDIRPRQTDDT
ncbi:HNH endonuclease signature motif containing protein [Microbacterium nymphoidis]|uniref:HNH endonuclease signature motif containing protein n=1 Tax=Microbacterium nymphoidis TaxID=2898586 RepID=UPI001E5B4E9E|nr:HNH endonuclease signature motif containing protein [Microbacterium nymphoidis]MCD2497708.1 HNH endonuclease [Microbacterium nymphoidis]